MNLDHQSVRHIARLARLAIQPDELDSYTRELERVLDLFEQLQRADVDALAPLSHPLDQIVSLRDDVALQSDPHNQLLGLAPDSQAGLYLVPKVLD